MGREIEKAFSQDFGLSSTENWGSSSRRFVEKSDSFEVKANPKVTVDAKGCIVSVRGWDNNEVKYRLTKVVSGKGKRDVNLTVNNSPSEVNINAKVVNLNTNNDTTTTNINLNGGTNQSKTIKIEGDEVTINGVKAPSDSSSETFKIEVFVPKKSILRILTDREIRVDGVTGILDLNGADETINVRDSEGKLKIRAADALIRVIGFSGEVDSKTADGANFFEGDFIRFSAITGDGKIVLTLPDDVNVDLQANKKINTEGFNLTEFNGDETHRRIGDGGTIYQLKANDGEIVIRNAKLLNTKY